MELESNLVINPNLGNLSYNNIMTAMASMLGGLQFHLNNTEKHSGILVARYPRIYKKIIIRDLDTNLKAKPNRNTLRFRLHHYHVPVGVTKILLKAGIALPWSHRRVTKVFGIFVHQFTAVLSNSITDSGIT